MPPQTTRAGWRDAAESLAGRDPVMARLYAAHGAPDLRPGPAPDDRFRALANSIAYQQLAGRAAAAIWSRVVATVGEPFTPEAVLDAGFDRLRAAGLSGSKATTFLGLAEHTLDGTIDWARIHRWPDDVVVEHLTVVRGIGPWTAHMFLLFDLRRPDVWPVGDYGVRAGYARAFDLEPMPTEKEMAALGEPWAPYRSVVAWWCWREVDTTTPG
jgi:3-methyladenine DNA glycosylase/8-oxoguanine DNA glycosylase